jgi:hypothetical protein
MKDIRLKESKMISTPLLDTSSADIKNIPWRQLSLDRYTRMRSTVDVVDILGNPTCGQS